MRPALRHLCLVIHLISSTGCGGLTAASSSAANAASAVHLTSDDFLAAYRDFQQAPNGIRAAVLADLGRMTFLDLYAHAATRASSAIIWIAGQQLGPAAEIVASQRPMFTALHQAFPSLAAYWRALRFDPEATSAADYQDGLAARLALYSPEGRKASTLALRSATMTTSCAPPKGPAGSISRRSEPPMRPFKLNVDKAAMTQWASDLFAKNRLSYNAKTETPLLSNYNMYNGWEKDQDLAVFFMPDGTCFVQGLTQDDQGANDGDWTQLVYDPSVLKFPSAVLAAVQQGRPAQLPGAPAANSSEGDAANAIDVTSRSSTRHDSLPAD